MCTPGVRYIAGVPVPFPTGQEGVQMPQTLLICRSLDYTFCKEMRSDITGCGRLAPLDGRLSWPCLCLHYRRLGSPPYCRVGLRGSSLLPWEAELMNSRHTHGKKGPLTPRLGREGGYPLPRPWAGQERVVARRPNLDGKERLSESSCLSELRKVASAHPARDPATMPPHPRRRAAKPFS